jgi:hypothetical protein
VQKRDPYAAPNASMHDEPAHAALPAEAPLLSLSDEYDGPNEEQENIGARDPIHNNSQGPTKAIETYTENVLSETHSGTFKVMKELGKGGFGVVSLCERTGPDVCPFLSVAFLVLLDFNAVSVHRGTAHSTARLLRAVLRVHTSRD